MPQLRQYACRVAVLHDTSLEFEGVLGVRAVVPPAVDWPEFPLASIETAFESTPLLRAELVVTDSERRRLSTVPVDFDRRVTRDGTTSLLGETPEGSLKVSLDATGPATGVKMRFHFEPHHPSSPTALLEIVSWFDALREGRELGLWMRDRGKWGVGPEPIPREFPRLPDDYARAVRVLARIEQRSGSSFLMPSEISESDAEAIGVADALLKGKTVAGRWNGASVNHDPQLVELLQDSPHGARLEFKATYWLELAEQHIVIGEVEYSFRQVELDGHDPHADVVRLQPGEVSDRFEVVLVAVPPRARDDGATSWVPGAMLEPFAGRWIAQSGTEVVESSDSFDDLSLRLKGDGRLATIWRVPETRERAEAHPLIAL